MEESDTQDPGHDTPGYDTDAELHPEPVAAPGNPTVAALLEERAGYERRGLPNRVAEVDAAIAAAGGTPPSGGIEAAARKPARRR